MINYDPVQYPAGPYTPKIIVCPTDDNPFEAHSYVLNKHLADKRIRFGSRNFGGLPATDVIVAGEKKTTERDYYMERRHGRRQQRLLPRSRAVSSRYHAWVELPEIRWPRGYEFAERGPDRTRSLGPACESTDATDGAIRNE